MSSVAFNGASTECDASISHLGTLDLFSCLCRPCFPAFFSSLVQEKEERRGIQGAHTQAKGPLWL